MSALFIRASVLRAIKRVAREHTCCDFKRALADQRRLDRGWGAAPAAEAAGNRRMLDVLSQLEQRGRWWRLA